MGKEGLYRLRLVAAGTPAEGIWPAVQVQADGKNVALLSVNERKPTEFPFLVRLPHGRVKLKISFINDLYRDGEDRNFTLVALLVDKEPLPDTDLAILSLPPAIVEKKPGPGQRVVIDCVRWDTNENNRVRGLRYASALFARLGAPFLPPTQEAEWIVPPRFRTAGEITVFSRTESSLNLGSGGTVAASFRCATTGQFTVLLRGWSTPLKGVYGKALLKIDGRRVSETELSAGVEREFAAGRVSLSAGRHDLTVEFINDQWAGPGGEDRNLYLTGVGFRSIK